MALAVIVSVVFGLLAVFTLQNAGAVTTRFIVWQFEASLALVILISAAGGFIAGIGATALLRLRRSFRENRRGNSP